MAQDGTLNDRTNGRWTRQQHEKFIQGLKLYGKNWKKIEQLIVTRNGSQIRSHAQKYFMKLNYKTSEASSGTENRNPQPPSVKDKEITTKKLGKKIMKYPTLDSPFFWQEIVDLCKNQSFNFWQLIQLSSPNCSSSMTNQKSFVAYQSPKRVELSELNPRPNN